jgi:hypothetical protein
MSLGRQNFIDPKTYKQLVWADLADDEEEEARLEREIARQLLVGAGRSRSVTAAGATGAAGIGAVWQRHGVRHARLDRACSRSRQDMCGGRERHTCR